MAEAATTISTSTDQGASSPAAAASTSGQAQTPTDWTTGLSDDLKGFVQNKGFKAPTDILESYRGLEKAMGAKAEHLIKLPENMDSPEGRAIWERLGAPKDAKDYKIGLAKEVGDRKSTRLNSSH